MTDSPQWPEVSKETKSNEEEDVDVNQRSEEATNTSWLREHAKEFLDEWTRGGVHRYVDLPMICVLGDTSSGKSSVLSSLIGLELPSASTLTTKCPVLVQLYQAKDEGPKALVQIQWHSKSRQSFIKPLESESRDKKRTIEKQVESHSPSKSTSSGASSGSASTIPLPPPPPPPKWEPRVITDQWDKGVPQAVLDAQQTILNFRQTPVAPDIIMVTLWSPRCTEELTLVDLPGIVQYQHLHQSSLLQQVDQVVLEYLKNPRSILLPVLPAPTNIHNSKVLQWCQEVDPDTQRTIPVLTKPDLMDPGTEHDIVDLLQNADTTETTATPSSRFQHGFYLVKNRGQAEADAGTPLENAWYAEKEYFANTLPWNTLSVPRLGIPALRIKLSQVLLLVMQESLPSIRGELTQQMEDAKVQLRDLGTLYTTRSDQRKYYHTLTTQLVSQVSSQLSGKGGIRHLQRKRSPHGTSRTPKNDASTQAMVELDGVAGGASQLHAACRVFSDEILHGSLATINKLVEGARVLVSTPDKPDTVRGEVAFVSPTLTYACVDFVDERDHTTEILFDRIDMVTEQPDFEPDEVWCDGNRVYIGREGGHFDSLRKIPCKQIRTDPSWLEDKMASFRTDDLACFVNVDMFQHLVADFVQEDWAPPCEQLLDTLEKIITQTLDHALTSIEGQTARFPLLRKLLVSNCRRIADQLLHTAKLQMQDHLETEMEHPYTQDQVLLQAINQARFQALQHDLEMHLRLGQEGVVYDTQAIQAILDRVFLKHQQNNWMAEQMELVLSSYGQIATQRVLDRTPQICWQTCRSLARALQEELGYVTDDALETCMWESPETQRRYETLTAELADLQKALDVVKTLR